MARKSVCIGCLRSFGEHKRRLQGASARQLTEDNAFVLKLCELLGGHFVYRTYDKRLPTYVCSTCTRAVFSAKAGDTIAVFQNKDVQRQELTRRGGIGGFVHFRCRGMATCPLCKLATKLPFGRVASPVVPPAAAPEDVIDVGVVSRLRRDFGTSQNKSLRICRYFAEH